MTTSPTSARPLGGLAPDPGGASFPSDSDGPGDGVAAADPGGASPAGRSVPRDLRALVGTVGTPRTIEVGADDVERFLLATEPRAWRTGSASTPAAPVTGDRAGVAAGTVAPPTFFCPDPIVAAEAMGVARPRPLARNIDGGSAWELRAPVRVGDTLTLVARIASITARTTGDGRPLITTVLEVEAWNQHGVSVGVASGRSLSYEDREAAPAPAAPAPPPAEGAPAGPSGGGFAVGQALPGLTVAGTTLEDVVRWSGAIGDYSDIHYDPAAAAARGLAGPVVNGPWKAALLLRMLADWAGERATVTALDCRYRRADVVGGPLACGGVVTRVTADGAHDLVTCDVWVTDGEGTRTVTGTATVRVLRPLIANGDADADDDGAVLATGALRAALRLGQEAGRFTYRVERGDIERFLAAIGDPVERWADPAAPDRLLAPPTFFAALDPVERRDLQIEQALDDIPYAKTGGGNAFNEVEYERPIREGDVITVVTSYAEVYERAGRAGRLLFRVRRNDYLDAGGALVARTRMGHVLAYDLDRMAR